MSCCSSIIMPTPHGMRPLGEILTQSLISKFIKIIIDTLIRGHLKKGVSDTRALHLTRNIRAKEFNGGAGDGCGVAAV